MAKLVLLVVLLMGQLALAGLANVLNFQETSLDKYWVVCRNGDFEFFSSGDLEKENYCPRTGALSTNPVVSKYHYMVAGQAVGDQYFELTCRDGSKTVLTAPEIINGADCPRPRLANGYYVKASGQNPSAPQTLSTVFDSSGELKQVILQIDCANCGTFLMECKNNVCSSPQSGYNFFLYVSGVDQHTMVRVPGSLVGVYKKVGAN